jgi:hypothetical protein
MAAFENPSTTGIFATKSIGSAIYAVFDVTGKELTLVQIKLKNSIIDLLNYKLAFTYCKFKFLIEL